MVSVEAKMKSKNKPSVWVVLAALLMCAAFGAAEFLKPTRFLAETLPTMNLTKMVPDSFAGWQVDPSVVPVLPDPGVEATLNSLYSKTLNRTYVRADGSRIMLSIAYGENQNSASTAAHRPEFCYTAQGFVVKRMGVESLQVLDHKLQVVRLMANAGRRHEPITYWVTLGDSASIPGLERKLDQMRYGLRGWIVDGMLMRISSLTQSIDAVDQDEAKNLQTIFINDLAKAMAPDDRARFFGSSKV